MSGDRGILVVSQFYWPELIGTAFYATDLAEWLASRGFSVTVVTARPNYPSFEGHEDYARGQKDDTQVNGVRIIRLPSPPPRGGTVPRRILFEAGLFGLGALRLCRTRSLRSKRVISFAPSALVVLLGALATRQGGKHLAFIHDIQSGLASGLEMVRNRPLASLIRWVERVALARPDHLVTISDRMKQALSEDGISTSVVLPLWVDTREIHPVPRPAASRPTVMYSGNLGRKQGLAQLLDVAAILQSERPDVLLLIQGAGSQEGPLQMQVEERKLSNVAMRPLVPRSGLNAALAEADIHVVPQLPEGADYAVPSKVYTIMAAGRPIVCTAGPGSTLWELMRQSNALTCTTARDPRLLADALIGLLDDRERRQAMGQRGRAFVERHANRESVLGEVARLMNLEICDARAPRSDLESCCTR